MAGRFFTRYVTPALRMGRRPVVAGGGSAAIAEFFDNFEWSDGAPFQWSDDEPFEWNG
jgi:hypothetical protein